jgi:hypothetical protein
VHQHFVVAFDGTREALAHERAPAHERIVEASGHGVADREQARGEPGEHSMDGLHAMYEIEPAFGLLEQVAMCHHRMPAHQVRDAEEPRARGTRDQEPERNAEHTVVRLHEDRILDRVRSGTQSLARIVFHEGARRAGGVRRVAAPERRQIVVGLLLEVARPERKNKDEGRERDVLEAREPLAEGERDRGDRQHRQDREDEGDENGPGAARPGEAPQVPFEVAVEPMRLAQVQPVRREPLDDQGQEQRDEVHRASALLKRCQSNAGPGSVLRPGATSL